MRWAVASLSILMSLTAFAEGDAAAGQSKAATCAACHGIDGNSTVANWPKLAGQHPDYLVRQTTLIRDGERPVPEMQALVASLDAQDIEDLAAYFSEQAAKPAAADEALVAAGEKLYRGGNADEGTPACLACHGAAGEGIPLAGYPKLAGQHATYTANMLKKFRAGDTWGEDDAPSQVMTGVARYLTDAEIDAVASYIEGLHAAGE
ncbi:cytochrome c4 [Marinihelvus fidelis]|uniref:Cytochrome c4 n=1 Tax=Marinihelvus fidelis TaxID=2613842 RepID=A0A5N0TC76_9GAMM|nr:cytochrome c4 [Marinihelvus fidelis]